MAKRTGGGRNGTDWRHLMAAVVVELGTRKVVGPHALVIPRRALRAVAGGGTLAATDLPNGGRLVTYTPPREETCRSRSCRTPRGRRCVNIAARKREVSAWS